MEIEKSKHEEAKCGFICSGEQHSEMGWFSENGNWVGWLEKGLYTLSLGFNLQLLL